MAGDSPLEIIVAVAIIAIAAMVFPAVADTLSTSGGGAGAARVDHAVVIEGSTSWLDVGPQDGSTGKNQTVRDSRGFSMRFTGASDSYLQSDSDFDVAAGNNWTIGTGVWVNDSAIAANNMTVFAAGQPDVILRYKNQSGTANWSAYIVNTRTYSVNVSAVDPTNNTYVYVSREGDDVTIYRYNSTANETGETVNVTGSNTSPVNLTTGQNFHGRLDETRTFNNTLSHAQRQAIVNDPIIPLTNATRTGRIMYDAGSGNAVRIYWASSGATASNTTYADGYDGNVLSESGFLSLLVSSGDYHWRTDGPELRIEEGGRLDGAPVAFAEYDRRDIRDRALDEIASGYEMMGLVMIVLIAGAVIAVVMRFRV